MGIPDAVSVSASPFEDLSAAEIGPCLSRIHRSAIVNIDVVEELGQQAPGAYVVLLMDGTEIRVGRRFRAKLQARLGQPL